MKPLPMARTVLYKPLYPIIVQRQLKISLLCRHFPFIRHKKIFFSIRHERKFDKQLSLFPHGRPVCGSFAVMQRSAQFSIDAYNAAIFGHPDIFFPFYFSGTGRSNQWRVRPVSHEAGHCHNPDPPQRGGDFFWDDPARFPAQQSCQSSVPAVSPHSARPNQDEHRKTGRCRCWMS